MVCMSKGSAADRWCVACRLSLRLVRGTGLDTAKGAKRLSVLQSMDDLGRLFQHAWTFRIFCSPWSTMLNIEQVKENVASGCPAMRSGAPRAVGRQITRLPTVTLFAVVDAVYVGCSGYLLLIFLNNRIWYAIQVGHCFCVKTGSGGKIEGLADGWKAVLTAMFITFFDVK